MAIGLLFLFVGGEALVRGSVTLSKRLGVSTLLIGVVVVGFGTSAPELLVSIKAALQDQPDIALGNVVGSNIANILLILGIAGILSPIACSEKGVKRDAIVVVAASLFLFILGYFGQISRPLGSAMVLLLAGYLFYSYRQEKQLKRKSSDIKTYHEVEPKDLELPMGLPLSLGLSVFGIALLAFGADYLVDGASNIAKRYGVSEATIGLSIVAIGTSLPEIATAISASLKKESDVIIGNVLGSNLFNILSILGITSVIHPLEIAKSFFTFDIPLALIVSVTLVALIYIRKEVSRISGILFLVFYISYITYLF